MPNNLRAPNRVAHTIVRLRVTTIFFAFSWGLLVIYGSFVPFNFQPISWEQTVAELPNIHFHVISVDSRADWVANGVLFYIWAWLVTAAAVWNKPGGRATLLATLIVVGLSTLAILIELAQLSFPRRTVSWNDPFAEILGTLLGTLTWLCFGKILVEHLRRFVAAEPREKLGYLITVYCLVLIIYGAAPFDFLASADEIQRKLEENRLALFSPPGRSTALMMGAFTLLGIGLSYNRSQKSAAVWGVLSCLSFEALKAATWTRDASFSELALATLAVAIGCQISRQTFHGPMSIAIGWVIAYQIAVTSAFWYPFDLIQANELQARVQEMLRIPLSGHYFGTEFQAASNLLTRLALFGMGGSLLAWSGRLTRPWLIANLVWPLATEFGQLVFADKLADPADAILSIIGVLGGFKGGQWINRLLVENQRLT